MGDEEVLGESSLPVDHICSLCKCAHVEEFDIPPVGSNADFQHAEYQIPQRCQSVHVCRPTPIHAGAVYSMRTWLAQHCIARGMIEAQPWRWIGRPRGDPDQRTGGVSRAFFRPYTRRGSFQAWGRSACEPRSSFWHLARLKHRDGLATGHGQCPARSSEWTIEQLSTPLRHDPDSVT